MNSKKKDVAIRVSGLRKQFVLPHQKVNSLKSAILNPFQRYEKETQKVLNDISFEIEHGEFFGIVGRNGAGKSTLLKCMAGVYYPDEGEIEINGTLVPFIELGVGFNPELSGRDNVFLNGALLGFNRKEMEEMYSDIVEFSELERFMDQKLKNYSSGMQVRLAFSIAIQAKGDILLLDEVLAVGDEAFQRKCYEYFNQLKMEGKTVILVTHSMAAIESFCTSALMVSDGKVKLIGTSHEVAAAYSKENDKAIKPNEGKALSKKANIKVHTRNNKGTAKKVFRSGELLNIELHWNYKGVRNVGVALFKSDGKYIYGTNTYIENKSFSDRQSITYKVKLNLAEGDYFIKVGLFGDNDKLKIAFDDTAARFTVNADKKDYRWHGLTKLESEWV